MIRALAVIAVLLAAQVGTDASARSGHPVMSKLGHGLGHGLHRLGRGLHNLGHRMSHGGHGHGHRHRG